MTDDAARAPLTDAQVNAICSEITKVYIGPYESLAGGDLTDSFIVTAGELGSEIKRLRDERVRLQAELAACREALEKAHEFCKAIPQACDGSGYNSRYRENDFGEEVQEDVSCSGCCACYPDVFTAILARPVGSMDALREMLTRADSEGFKAGMIAQQFITGGYGVKEADMETDEARITRVIRIESDGHGTVWAQAVPDAGREGDGK